MASSARFYVDWAKERLDEMDAALASLEGRVARLTGESRASADKLIADLRAKHDVFQQDMKKLAQGSEAALLKEKARLESEWNAFEADVKKYVEGVGQELKQQQATFQDVAAAQLNAWRKVAHKIQAASAELAADRRTEIEAAVERMKADASAAEAKLQKLKEAGTQSWSALTVALAESRASFDRANQTAWDAFKRAS